MLRLFVTIFLLSVLEHTNAYCCFRDTWMLSPKCGCSDFDPTPCGVVLCSQSCAYGDYGCNQPAFFNSGPYDCSITVPIGSSFCGCGLPACSSYRDTSNVCIVSDNPSPICSCLKTENDFDCGCEEMRSFIYFPEVEYPIMALEMKPFYYSGCWCY